MNDMDLEITETNQLDDDNTKNKRGPKKDRSEGKYSQEDFQAMSRQEQFEIAKEYYMRSVEEFDDGTFNFSQSTFKRLCENLGFTKGIIDTRVDEAKEQNTSVEKETIWLDDIKRVNPVSKKITVSKDILDKIEDFFKKEPRLTNVEKSLLIELFLRRGVDSVVGSVDDGNAEIALKPVSKRVLFKKP